MNASFSAERLAEINSQMGFFASQFCGNVRSNTPVIYGDWSHFTQGSGLYIHYGEFEETADLSLTLELPAGLSFTLLYAGEIAFAIGGNNYFLGKTIRPVECSCYSLARPDLLTRHVRKGQKVQKLNLFVERSWLEKRCRQLKPEVQIESLFQRHAEIRYWAPSIKLLTAISEFTRVSAPASLEQQLARESQAIHLAALFVESLSFHEIFASKPAWQQEKRLRNNYFERVKQHIDSNLDQPQSVSDIANSMGTSVSTLQRRFKSASGMTVAEYMRFKKLERAKLALVRDGLSIGEASYLAGYNHTANFISAFTRQYAISPDVFRRKHRLNNQ